MSGDVSLTVYGEASANDANVVFPMDMALPAARNVWQLADEVEASKGQLSTAQTSAQRDWLGPHREVFDSKCTTYSTSAGNTADAIRALATGLAEAWAAARGQQDRINKARYVEHEISDDGAVENFFEHFSGEDDYGPPPDNPGVPGGPGFAETRAPMHSEFGP